MVHRILLTLALTGVLSAADPWIGVWKMNYEKSKFPGAPPKDVTLTYEKDEKGLKFTSRGKLQDGSPYTYHYVAATDGKDYPVIGHGSYNTVSVTWKNGKLESQYKRDSQVMTIHSSEFSADGKAMITTTEWKNQNGESFTTVGYFDRQ